MIDSYIRVFFLFFLSHLGLFTNFHKKIVTYIYTVRSLICLNYWNLNTQELYHYIRSYDAKLNSVDYVYFNTFINMYVTWQFYSLMKFCACTIVLQCYISVRDGNKATLPLIMVWCPALRKCTQPFLNEKHRKLSISNSDLVLTASQIHESSPFFKLWWFFLNCIWLNELLINTHLQN